MNSFQFTIRVYIKNTRITPFIMPRDGMYKCNWTSTGICNFEGVENGYAELYSRLDEQYFHMDEKVDEGEALIEYYDRTREDLRGIGSQEDFERALRHSSETYSPFSLVIKVNAKRREEHWYNGEAIEQKVRFGSAWRISKPKFTCIREWLMSLERNGQVCEHVLDSCSYGEKAFLYSQFSRQGSNNWTNQKVPQLKMDQSKSPFESLTSIRSPTSSTQKQQLELLEPANPKQKMLQEKMMIDPVISMILFNEYIPLRAGNSGSSSASSASAVCEKMGGLFLGKCEDEAKGKETENISNTSNISASAGMFIRSELPPPAEANKPTATGGIFIRSTEDAEADPSDDWVIA